MNARVRALALTLSVTLGLPLLASLRPQAADAQEDATTVEARKRFVEGVKLFDQKKYDLARAAFLQAYALKKHPDVLLNLAQSELLGGLPMEAAGHFKEFLRDPATSNHPKRSEADKGLADARAKLGRVQITVDQADADVFLDGKKVGTSPLAEPFDVTPGPHTIEAKKSGKSSLQPITAPEGKITIVNLVLGGTSPPPSTITPPPPTAEPPPPPPPTASTSAPPPTLIDDKKDDKGTSFSSDDLSGKREPFMRWAQRSPVAYVGAGLTAVGLGLGIGFGIAANSAQSNADTLANKIRSTAASDPDPSLSADRRAKPCPDLVTSVSYVKACANLRDNLDAASSNRKVMTVGIVVGVVGIGTIVGGYFLTAKKTDSAGLFTPRVAFSPVLGPSVAGLGAYGSF